MVGSQRVNISLSWTWGPRCQHGSKGPCLPNVLAGRPTLRGMQVLWQSTETKRNNQPHVTTSNPRNDIIHLILDIEAIRKEGQIPVQWLELRPTDHTTERSQQEKVMHRSDAGLFCGDGGLLDLTFKLLRVVMENNAKLNILCNSTPVQALRQFGSLLLRM